MDRDEMKRPRTNDERISYKDGSDSERDVPSAPDTDTKRSVSMENTNRSLEDIIKDATERELDRFPKAELTPEALLAMERRHDRRKRKKILRIASIAAMFIIIAAGAVFVTGGYFDAGADKNPKEEIVTDDGIVSRDGGYGDQGGEDSFIVKDWNKVEGYYKELFPSLVIPKYIPAEYSFSVLQIYDDSDTRSYQYEFTNGNKKILLHEYSFLGNLESMEIKDYDRFLECNYGKIWVLNTDGKIKATIQLDGGSIVELWGDFDDKTIIKVMNSLEL